MGKIFQWKNAQIQYQTWGQPSHSAVLFFHGFPGSYIQAGALEPYVAHHKIFVISADRPGYGGTSATLDREDFLSGLAALLKKYKVKHLHLLGVSGGAPWAHLMACKVPTKSLSIVCGLATFNAANSKFFSRFQWRGLHLSRLLPKRVLLSSLSMVLKILSPEKKIQFFQKIVDPRDKGLLGNPMVRTMVLKSMSQSRAQGAKGIVGDLKLYQTDWLKLHCDTKVLRKIPIHYYHGKKDKILSYHMSEAMHASLPHSSLELFANEGHYSLALKQIPKVLSRLGNSGF